METELYFDIDPGFSLIEQGLLAFDEGIDIAWPLDEINAALEWVYQHDLEHVVQMYPTQWGWLVSPMMQWDDVDDIFLGVAQACGYHDAETESFLFDLPFSTGGECDGIPVAVVAYEVPWGPRFPVDAVNDALRVMLGQDAWPDTMGLYLYVVQKEGTDVWGLWIADTNELFAGDYEAQAVAFHGIMALNKQRGAADSFPDFVPRRYTI